MFDPVLNGTGSNLRFNMGLWNGSILDLRSDDQPVNWVGLRWYLRLAVLVLVFWACSAPVSGQAQFVTQHGFVLSARIRVNNEVGNIRNDLIMTSVTVEYGLNGPQPLTCPFFFEQSPVDGVATALVHLSRWNNRVAQYVPAGEPDEEIVGVIEMWAEDGVIWAEVTDGFSEIEGLRLVLSSVDADFANQWFGLFESDGDLGLEMLQIHGVQWDLSDMVDNSAGEPTTQPSTQPAKEYESENGLVAAKNVLSAFGESIRDRVVEAPSDMKAFDIGADNFDEYVPRVTMGSRIFNQFGVESYPDVNEDYTIEAMVSSSESLFENIQTGSSEYVNFEAPFYTTSTGSFGVGEMLFNFWVWIENEDTPGNWIPMMWHLFRGALILVLSFCLFWSLISGFMWSIGASDSRRIEQIVT